MIEGIWPARKSVMHIRHITPPVKVCARFGDAKFYCDVNSNLHFSNSNLHLSMGNIAFA